uniref:EGF-like domain-containing protein n=1 Tax=Magallana gigas TaxID=29159 RepID=K1Q025_MAGGI
MEVGCTGNTDCRKNAICKTVMYNTECECESGFYDFPPYTTAENQGCLGECNDVGETDQCKGNTQCELTTQGYGKCMIVNRMYNAVIAVTVRMANVFVSRGMKENTVKVI